MASRLHETASCNARNCGCNARNCGLKCTDFWATMNEISAAIPEIVGCTARICGLHCTRLVCCNARWKREKGGFTRTHGKNMKNPLANCHTHLSGDIRLRACLILPLEVCRSRLMLRHGETFLGVKRTKNIVTQSGCCLPVLALLGVKRTKTIVTQSKQGLSTTQMHGA